jgi:hypothetical protein
MTVDELAAWSEFIGGIAVVAGLFFVGVQLLQANREARIAANQGYRDSIVRMGELLSSNPDLAKVYLSGLEGIDELAEVDRVRFITFVSQVVLRTYENLYSQYLDKRLEADVWKGAAMSLDTALQEPGFKDVWQMRKNWYANDFQAYVETTLQNAGSGQPLYRLEREA